MLASLLYASTASTELDSGNVFEIIQTSARRNPTREITGFLLFDGREFLQYVEGPPAELDRLLDTLCDDPRHHSVRVLHCAACDKRLFPKWAMRRAGAGAEQDIATIRRSGLPAEMLSELDRFETKRRAA